MWVTLLTAGCTAFVCFDCFACRFERMVGMRFLMLCVICWLIRKVRSSALGFTSKEEGWNLGVL